MSAEIENAVREDLSRQAETVVASDELKRAILDRMAPERAGYVRVQRLRVLAAAAAAVVLAVIGVSVLREGSDSGRPQPAPPVPSMGHNAELLEEMPTGAAPRVLVRDKQGTVTSPDGTTFAIGVERNCSAVVGTAFSRTARTATSWSGREGPRRTSRARTRVSMPFLQTARPSTRRARSATWRRCVRRARWHGPRASGGSTPRTGPRQASSS